MSRCKGGRPSAADSPTLRRVSSERGLNKLAGYDMRARRRSAEQVVPPLPGFTTCFELNEEQIACLVSLAA